jgi:hypothetical protein
MHAADRQALFPKGPAQESSTAYLGEYVAKLEGEARQESVVVDDFADFTIM